MLKFFSVHVARYNMGLGMALAATVYRFTWFDAAMVFGMERWVVGSWWLVLICILRDW